MRSNDSPAGFTRPAALGLAVMTSLSLVGGSHAGTLGSGLEQSARETAKPIVSDVPGYRPATVAPPSKSIVAVSQPRAGGFVSAQAPPMATTLRKPAAAPEPVEGATTAGLVPSELGEIAVDGLAGPTFAPGTPAEIAVEGLAEPRFAPRSPVEIDQIPGSVAVASFAAPEADLAAQIAAMQVPAPGRLATAEDRAALLATAPDQISVRFGDVVLGKVAVRNDAGGGVSVQLSGLLDTLQDRFAPEEFERLSASAAAQSFVGLSELADKGIELRYDPAYDELALGT